MTSVFKRKYKQGLVLSGGGARGFAHLGVLQCFEEHNICPSIISGVSAGSIVGAFYSDGYKPLEIFKLFSSQKMYRLMRLTFPRFGVLRVSGLKEILVKNLRSKRIEDLPIPLVIAVTNYNTGKIEYLSEGNLADAVLASAAIPVLFEVQKINGNFYFDGGVMDNLPLKPILGRCKKIIAVHVNPLGKIEKINGLMQVAERAFHLAIGAELENKKQNVDLFIEPPELTEYGLLDVKNSLEMFKIGYKHTSQVLGK